MKVAMIAPYLAGYVDGDGCISVTYIKHPRARRGATPRPYVSVITKNREFAQELHSLIGEPERSFMYKDSREKKVGYVIHITSNKGVLRFLQRIAPYLRLKKRQAELLIEFCSERLNRSVDGRGVPVSDQCWEIAEEVRRLNG